MKHKSHDESICLFSLLFITLIYLGAMAMASNNYMRRPTGKDIVLRCRAGRHRRSRNTRLFAFKN